MENYEELKAKFFEVFAKVPDPLRDEIIAVIDDDTYTWRTANAEIEHGDQEKAKSILAVFSWGHSFLDLNHSLLEKYSLAKNSSEVVQIQKEISKD